MLFIHSQATQFIEAFLFGLFQAKCTLDCLTCGNSVEDCQANQLILVIES